MERQRQEQRRGPVVVPPVTSPKEASTEYGDFSRALWSSMLLLARYNQLKANPSMEENMNSFPGSDPVLFKIEGLSAGRSSRGAEVSLCSSQPAPSADSGNHSPSVGMSFSAPPAPATGGSTGEGTPAMSGRCSFSSCSDRGHAINNTTAAFALKSIWADGQMKPSVALVERHFREQHPIVGPPSAKEERMVFLERSLPISDLLTRGVALIERFRFY